MVAGTPPPAALLAVAQVTHSSVTTNKASTRKRNLINSPSKKRFPEARGIARFLRRITYLYIIFLIKFLPVEGTVFFFLFLKSINISRAIF